MEKQFFTVREANQLIPFLTERLEALLRERRRLTTLAREQTPPLPQLLVNGGMLVPEEYFRRVTRLQSLASEIGSTGCQIKDVETGLIDFPTLWEGREVYLCWKLGETEVQFWHELDTGFAGRQPLKGES